MVLFFTLPPDQVPWGWVLVNQFNVDLTPRTITWEVDGKRVEIRTTKNGLDYILRWRNIIEYVLLDAGVEKLFRRKDPPTEYPPEYEKLWWSNVQRLIRIIGEERLIVVLPDYPDDYVPIWGRHHALWRDGKDNIERTVENICYYWDKYCRKHGLKCMVPVQGYWENPMSIQKSVKLLHDYGILKEAEIFGIANLCTTRKYTVIVKTAKYARQLLPDKWIHIFGPSLKAVKELILHIDATPHAREILWFATGFGMKYDDAKKIPTHIRKALYFMSFVKKIRALFDSFDSTAYTFPRWSHGWSAKTLKERIEYFYNYIKSLVKVEEEESEEENQGLLRFVKNDTKNRVLER